MNDCRTPASWAALERYHIGELPLDQHRAVAEHLRGCAACAALLARIAEDDARELPPLPPPAPKPGRGARLARYARPPRVVAIASGLAMAAAVALVVGRSPRHDEVEARAKGSDVSFVLVREDESLVAEAGGTYRDGDRFKALVTCPPELQAEFDLVVFEHGHATFPLGPTERIACGNAVALPGAFRASGQESMTVCLVWNEDGSVDREAVQQSSPESLPHAACKTLDPLP